MCNRNGAFESPDPPPPAHSCKHASFRHTSWIFCTKSSFEQKILCLEFFVLKVLHVNTATGCWEFVLVADTVTVL